MSLHVHVLSMYFHHVSLPPDPTHCSKRHKLAMSWHESGAAVVRFTTLQEARYGLGEAMEGLEVYGWETHPWMKYDEIDEHP